MTTTPTRAPRRSTSPLTIVTTALLTAYLITATVVLANDAATPADRAATHVVGIAAGAAFLVLICLLWHSGNERAEPTKAEEPGDAASP